MDEISYERFGVNFVTHVVTPERVGATIARLAGAEVTAGPMAAGPGGAASVRATGRVGPIREMFKLTLTHLRDPMVATGRVTAAEVDEALRLLDDPTFIASPPAMIAAWGRKP